LIHENSVSIVLARKAESNSDGWRVLGTNGDEGDAGAYASHTYSTNDCKAPKAEERDG